MLDDVLHFFNFLELLQKVIDVIIFLILAFFLIFLILTFLFFFFILLGFIILGCFIQKYLEVIGYVLQMKVRHVASYYHLKKRLD